MDINKLKKYLNNNCSAKELDEIIEWFKNESSSNEGRNFFFRIWEDIPDDEVIPDKRSEFDALLDKIHHEVNLLKSKELLEKSNFNFVSLRKKHKFFSIIRNAAAFLFLGVIGILIYLTFHRQLESSTETISIKACNEVFSSADAITKVSLPDGSNVWLNHRSSLRYPAIFDKKQRIVELKGEGYFEVAHCSERPFIVDAGEVRINAKGTTFNVMAYPEEDKIETSLIDGIVEIQKESTTGNPDIAYMLKPKELAVYNKNDGNIKTRIVDDDRYFSWKEGKLVFTAEPLEEVAKKLSRWFNVDIQIVDPELKSHTITATFVNETLNQVMELISMVSPISYTISDREKLTDGSFQRRTVKMKLKK